MLANDGPIGISTTDGIIGTNELKFGGRLSETALSVRTRKKRNLRRHQTAILEVVPNKHGRLVRTRGR